MRCLVRLAVFALCFVLPSIAHAHLRLARDHDHDDPERKGLVLGMMLQEGVGQYGKQLVPVTRFHYIIGGGITDRITLTAQVGVQKLHGWKKVGIVTDIVATGYVGRGFFLRAGAGVASQTVVMARDPLKPGVGGLLGLGYEWRIADKVGLALGLDYDVRMRPDRLPAQSVLLGLRLGGYLRK